ncbi:UNVERIFIED_CONTAM: hypothetical protein GTU68_031553 [Idotea baltica]|nr:hypothetical protein [Idotea baltica]MCL4145336.1 hypothetical protein [Idotea baltica]
MSNSLWLERKRGWAGLLVEPDASNYVALKRKGRKAWMAKACLSVNQYPQKVSSNGRF